MSGRPMMIKISGGLGINTRFASSGRRASLATLGLPDDASSSDIRKAFLNLTKEYHPDVNTAPGAKEKFQNVKVAYENLRPRPLKEAENGRVEEPPKRPQRSVMDEWVKNLGEQERKHKKKEQDDFEHFEKWNKKFKKHTEEDMKEFREEFREQQKGYPFKYDKGFEEQYSTFEERFIHYLEKIPFFQDPKSVAKVKAERRRRGSSDNLGPSATGPFTLVLRVFLNTFAKSMLSPKIVTSVSLVVILLLGHTPASGGPTRLQIYLHICVFSERLALEGHLFKA